MVGKERLKPTDSPKVEVGEIDTSAPFQSVKDAVSRFGKGAFSGEKVAIKKTRPHSAERVLAKETQVHLIQKELNKLKERLNYADLAKAQALVELKHAKTTVADLNQKLKTVGELKESAIKATEIAMNQTKKLEEVNCENNPEGRVLNSWKGDIETAREQYMTAKTEVDVSKQELRKIRMDCDSSVETKNGALKQAMEAENVAKAHMEKSGELSKEISSLRASIEQVKYAALQAHQKQANIYLEKDLQKQSHKAKLEESAKKLLALKNEFDPELTKNLEAQLTTKISEIDILQKETENAKASDLGSVKTVTMELDGAKSSLQKVAEEENKLRNLLESLKLELENLKHEHLALNEKEAETEALAEKLNSELRKSKEELEACVTLQSEISVASDEMISTLHRLSSETEDAKREANEMKMIAQDLKTQSESTKVSLKELETTLKVARQEAEEAKTAELKAIDQIKQLSETTTAARASMSESEANISLSKEEFESLTRKVQEFEMLAEMKVGAAMAQVEAVKASEYEVLKKLEASQKEVEDIKIVTQDALKRADMAEAAKRAVEGELRKWYERDQKKAAEAASRILPKFEKTVEPAPPPPPPPYKQDVKEKSPGAQKYGKSKSLVSKKTLLPQLSGFFSRKKNQVEGGSPSYLPGETPI